MRKNAFDSTEHLISRKIEIDAAHRVPKHGSKCRGVHGHRYVVEAWCAGPLSANEQEGMVIDFGFLKEEMVSVIDEPCDHSAIFAANDPILKHLLNDTGGMSGELAREGYCQRSYDYGKVYVIPDAPTAENLAKHWFERLSDRVRRRTDGRCRLAMVKVWETPNCWAAYGPLAVPDLSAA